jgi:phage-related protein
MTSHDDSKDLVLFFGEIKTPPFSELARTEVGYLLRQLQEGIFLSMPVSRPMPNIGKNCHELRITDGENKREWRVIYRIGETEIVVFDVFSKTTQKTPKRTIDNCQARIRVYDDGVGVE